MQIKNYLKTAWTSSDRFVSRTLNVSHSTVAIVRKEMRDSGRYGHLTNEAEKWREHQYLLDNPALLERLNVRGLRAIKHIEVLDFLMANPQIKSPCVAQAMIAKQAKEKRKNASITLTEADIDIRVADCTKKLSWVKPNSVKLAICDPYYGATGVEVAKGCARNAARVLAPGGSLLMLIGQRHLPDFLKVATTANEELVYHWCIAAPLNQSSPNSVHWLGVSAHWRCILWLVKKPYKPDGLISDLLNVQTRNSIDKEHHPWAQSIEIYKTLIEQLSLPGDTVADFTLGGGNCALASAILNRRFVGCDIEAEAVSKVKKRIRTEIFGGSR